MNAQRYRALSAYQRAVVAVAVLLDGHEAGVYLENDSLAGAGLAKSAEELASQPPELRMPFVGSVLRAALAELDNKV
jgi:hypothetical protein